MRAQKYPSCCGHENPESPNHCYRLEFAHRDFGTQPGLITPALPAERVSELRTAFDAMLKDPELLAEAARQGLEIDPVSGVEMEALVDHLHQAPPEVIDLVRRINAVR